MSSASADEIDDLDFIAGVDHGGIVGGFLDDREIQFDSNAPRVDFQPFEQRADAERPLELVRVAIESDGHGLSIVPRAEDLCTLAPFAGASYN